MKATGWEFASHTWGHINVGQKSLEGIQTDTEKWLNYVSPLIGGTDVIIFAFGADLGDWTGYTTDNEKFNYLKNQGFDIYCNVDSTSTGYSLDLTISARDAGTWTATACTTTCRRRIRIKTT